MMIITISGPPGSGKTTVGRLLAEKLGYEFISTGMVFRDMAEERHMTLAEFGKLASENHDIDLELDKRIVAIALDRKKIVLEGRLAGHMLHLNGIKSFKVWIDATMHTRASRIAGREGKTPEQTEAEIAVRENCEQERYRSIYGIDSKSLAVYDHVVISDEMKPEQIVDEIITVREAKTDV